MQSLQEQIVSLRRAETVQKTTPPPEKSQVVKLPAKRKQQKEPQLPPLNEAQYQQVREVATQAALETAEKFLDNIPDAVRRQLSETQIETWRTEMARQLESSLSSELSWSLNQVWLEAREQSISKKAS